MSFKNPNAPITEHKIDYDPLNRVDVPPLPADPLGRFTVEEGDPLGRYMEDTENDLDDWGGADDIDYDTGFDFD